MYKFEGKLGKKEAFIKPLGEFSAELIVLVQKYIPSLSGKLLLKLNGKEFQMTINILSTRDPLSSWRLGDHIAGLPGPLPKGLVNASSHTPTLRVLVCVCVKEIMY